MQIAPILCLITLFPICATKFFTRTQSTKFSRQDAETFAHLLVEKDGAYQFLASSKTTIAAANFKGKFSTAFRNVIQRLILHVNEDKKARSLPQMEQHKMAQAYLYMFGDKLLEMLLDLKYTKTDCEIFSFSMQKNCIMQFVRKKSIIASRIERIWMNLSDKLQSLVPEKASNSAKIFTENDLDENVVNELAENADFKIKTKTALNEKELNKVFGRSSTTLENICDKCVSTSFKCNPPSVKPGQSGKFDNNNWDNKAILDVLDKTVHSLDAIESEKLLRFLQSKEMHFFLKGMHVQDYKDFKQLEADCQKRFRFRHKSKILRQMMLKLHGTYHKVIRMLLTPMFRHLKNIDNVQSYSKKDETAYVKSSTFKVLMLELAIALNKSLGNIVTPKFDDDDERVFDSLATGTANTLNAQLGVFRKNCKTNGK